MPYNHDTTSKIFQHSMNSFELLGFILKTPDFVIKRQVEGKTTYVKNEKQTENPELQLAFISSMNIINSKYYIIISANKIDKYENYWNELVGKDEIQRFVNYLMEANNITQSSKIVGAIAKFLDTHEKSFHVYNTSWSNTIDCGLFGTCANIGGKKYISRKKNISKERKGIRKNKTVKNRTKNHQNKNQKNMQIL
jgi:hypothetical protein